MSKRDYYDVLGISKNASAEEIKTAYKKLAKQFHPDVSKEPNAEHKFKEVLEAYTVLNDSQKRQAFDQFGFGGEKFSGFSGNQGGFDYRNFSSQDFDFEDLFSGFGSIFGEQFGERERNTRGHDLRYDLNISFEEAAFGIKKDILFERIDTCSNCQGTGAKDAKSVTTCTECNGKGIARKMQRTILGMMATQTTCSKCRGKGKIVKEKCAACNSNGKVMARKKVNVTIPEGVSSGMHLRLKEEGNSGEEGGEKGDLFVVIIVEPHEFFKRDNGDILVDVPISLTISVLGGEIDVPTLKGKAKLKIPEGTQSNTVFRLKKEGIKDYRTSEKGDEFVKVIINIPKKLSKKQKELFEEIQKLEKDDKNNEFFGFFGKKK
ncbi:MAG: molecular chaperone DnaJ [archaeon]|nr:molecular chaperone DnaJ [archaeon]